jgi:hypothetical protein
MPSVLCSDGIGRWREARSCGHNVASVIRMHDAWDHRVASRELGWDERDVRDVRDVRDGMGWDADTWHNSIDSGVLDCICILEAIDDDEGEN